MQSVDEFIESLLTDKGITDIEPDIKEELKTDMKKRLLDQINRAAVMQLSEEKADELAKLVEDPNFTNEEMTKFMQDSGVNLTEVALDTMLKFRSFYLGTGE
jgi:flagellar biosynthesis regulator FlaF